jgi:hypothetical protein
MITEILAMSMPTSLVAVAIRFARTWEPTSGEPFRQAMIHAAFTG